jgi:hypothetical protein
MQSVTTDVSPVTDDSGAAANLGVATGTLRNWRSQGRGPKYVRLGRRVLYRLKDLDAYTEACLVDPEATR